MREVELLKKPIFWLILSLILVWVAVFSLPDNKLHLVFCDVGQGDATLISYRNTQVLIDGGPDNKVLGCLSGNMPFWDRTVEMVVLTHPQADHFTGLIDVIQRYSVRQFVSNSIVNDTASFWKFYQAVLEEKAPVYSPKAGEKIKIGPMDFLVLSPPQRLGDSRIWEGAEVGRRNFDSASDSLAKKHFLLNETHRRSQSEASQNLSASPRLAPEVLGAATYSGELNETSIVLRLIFGNFDVLLTGDIGFDIEKQLNLTPVEILKVAHHGSKYSTSEEFLEKIKPVLAVISVGKNRFGHPTKEVIERLKAEAIKILRTDEEGEIEVVSDGKVWKMVK
jgi:competence protein ComEC